LFNQPHKRLLLPVNVSDEQTNVCVGVPEISCQCDESSGVLQSNALILKRRALVAQFALTARISSINELEDKVFNVSNYRP